MSSSMQWMSLVDLLQLHYTFVCLWIHIIYNEYNCSYCQRSIHICHYQQETVSWKEQNSQYLRKQVDNMCKRADFCYTKQDVKK
jgi:hypothetical protein